MKYLRNKKFPLLAFATIAGIILFGNQYFTIDTVKISDNESSSANVISHDEESFLNKTLVNNHTNSPQSELFVKNSRNNNETQIVQTEQQSSCIDDSLQESSYYVEAYLANNLGLTESINYLIHNINSCSTVQSKQIISQLFKKPETQLEAFRLAVEIYHEAKQSSLVLDEIRNTDFNTEQLKNIMAEFNNSSIDIKAALIPSILRNDNLDSLIALTSYDYLYSNAINRNNEKYTDQQAANHTANLITVSLSQNLDTSGQIYPYLLDTYPEITTSSALTKRFINNTQTNQEL